MGVRGRRARAMVAMMQMIKPDIDGLKKAYQGQ
jgi:hypothetical protein